MKKKILRANKLAREEKEGTGIIIKFGVINTHASTIVLKDIVLNGPNIYTYVKLNKLK